MDALDTTGTGAVVGATHNQTVTVLNNGPDSSSPAVVTITATFGQQLSPAPSSAYSCTSKLLATVVTCTIGTLEASLPQQVSWSVKYTTAGAKTVTIGVSGPNADPNTANNTAVIATPAASSDLTLVNAEDSTGGPAYLDAPHSQAIEVRNLGPDDSPKTVATVAASAGQQLTAVASSSYTCTSDFPKTVLTCTIPTLGSGGVVVVRWTAKFTTAGAKTVTIKVSGPNADPAASNNTGAINTPQPSSDLAVSDATDLTGGPALAGATHEQGVIISNLGPDTSRRTVITITANSGQQLSAPGAGCTRSLGRNILTCTVIDFDSGTAFGMYWFVTYTSGGTKAVTIKVSGANADPNAANNTGAIATPAATSDLAVANATDLTGGPAQVGATHQQGAAIGNLGPHLSPKIVVTITASSGQQLSAAGPGCTVNFTRNVLTCTFANVGSGTSFALFWSVKYTGGGAKTVSIKVNGPNADPNAANNTAVINTAG